MFHRKMGGRSFPEHLTDKTRYIYFIFSYLTKRDIESNRRFHDSFFQSDSPRVLAHGFTKTSRPHEIKLHLTISLLEIHDSKAIGIT